MGPGPGWLQRGESARASETLKFAFQELEAPFKSSDQGSLSMGVAPMVKETPQVCSEIRGQMPRKLPDRKFPATTVGPLTDCIMIGSPPPLVANPALGPSRVPLI